MSRTICFILLISAMPAWAQMCRTTSIPPSTPDTQFVVNGDGTVSDKRTGLMWKQCLEGRSGTNCSAGNDAVFKWQEAMQHVESTNTQGGYANYTNWRLPNIRELRSLVEEQCVDPAINLAVFPSTYSGYVWSGSPSETDSVSSWFVGFRVGNANYSNRARSLMRVRLVRNGEVTTSLGGNIPLEISSWRNMTSSAWSELPEGLEVFGAGYRDLGSACMKNALDLRGATIYLKWSPKAHNYAGYGFRLLSGDDYFAGKIFHYGPFTSSHSWKGSTVVQGGVDYYTRIVTNGSGDFESVTAMGDYDDQGGAVIRQETTSAVAEMMPKLNTASVCFGVWDNYGGTNESITLKQLIVDN